MASSGGTGIFDNVVIRGNDPTVTSSSQAASAGAQVAVETSGAQAGASPLAMVQTTSTRRAATRQETKVARNAYVSYARTNRHSSRTLLHRSKSKRLVERLSHVVKSQGASATELMR